jgi:succinate-semialdehyde dehydrogenase/glutarate-semialdehyde dehydrogenase
MPWRAGARAGRGQRIGNEGWFFAPTVLSDTPLDAEIMNEEPFGPVALINRYPHEEAMIAEANRLPYGLAAYAWTENARRQRASPPRWKPGCWPSTPPPSAGRMRPSAGSNGRATGMRTGRKGCRLPRHQNRPRRLTTGPNTPSGRDR